MGEGIRKLCGWVLGLRRVAVLGGAVGIVWGWHNGWRGGEGLSWSDKKAWVVGNFG